jgi:hypothetical protein
MGKKVLQTQHLPNRLPSVEHIGEIVRALLAQVSARRLAAMSRVAPSTITRIAHNKTGTCHPETARRIRQCWLQRLTTSDAVASTRSSKEE